MIKVLFVCLGNICRSPMGEAIFRDMVKKKGISDKISADSCGTGGYHIGEPPHAETRKILKKHGISYDNIKASKFLACHLKEFDYIIAMDKENLEDILRIKEAVTNADYKAEIKLLSYFAGESKTWVSVPDPWYTGNFELTYNLITAGCDGLLEYIANAI